MIPYEHLRQHLLAAQRMGRPAAVEPADVLLLIDRVKMLEAVARAARSWNPEHPHDRGPLKTRRGCPGCRLDRALERVKKGGKKRGR